METKNNLEIIFDYNLLDSINIVEETPGIFPEDLEVIEDKEIEDCDKLNFKFIDDDKF